MPKKVLVFCLSGLGDAILASPALAALAAAPERFRLTLVTMLPWVAEYLRDQELATDVRLIPFIGMSKREVFSQAARLRRERFDISIIPYAMNRLGYNVLNFVACGQQRIGFRYQRQRRMNLPGLNHIVLDEDPSLHAVEENLRWAGLVLGVDWRMLPQDLLYRVPPEGLETAERFLCEHSLRDAALLVGLHAGCNSLKNQQSRLWPAARFAELLNRLAAEQPGTRFLIFQGPRDVEINNAVLAGLGAGRERVGIADRLPMRVVAGLMRRCHIFLSNDSGLMHTAAACRVPCISIYGATNPVWDGPWKTEVVVVSRHLPCSPCFYYSSRPLDCPAKLDYACVRELPVEDVEKAARQLLELVKM